jgi:hypothetical protein
VHSMVAFGVSSAVEVRLSPSVKKLASHIKERAFRSPHDRKGPFAAPFVDKQSNDPKSSVMSYLAGQAWRQRKTREAADVV